MIGSLCGRIKAIRESSLIIDVGGVGFRVFVVESLLDGTARVGQTIELFTYLCVRENNLSLYGFHSLEAHDLFVTLLGVSGIGPRTALAILSSFSPETLRGAIASGDASALTHIPGIGRKTAQRLILDLRDKIGMAAEPWVAAPLQEGDADVINALTSLGYSLSEAHNALAAVSETTKEVDERILAALRFLGGG